MFKKIAAWVIISCVLMLGNFSSCAKEQRVFEYDSEKSWALISVFGVDGEVIVKEEKVGFKEGATIFDCTRFILEKAEIAYDYSGFGSSVYIKGINELYEKENGALSGWLYRLNESFEKTNVSSGGIEVTSGDKIEWFYSKDGGKDIGSSFS